MSALVEIDRSDLAHCQDSLKALYNGGEGPSLDFLIALLEQPGTCVWGITQRDEIVAAAWFRVVLDEAELVDIRVSHAVRRSGIGRRLLTQTLRCLGGEGVTCCHLDVRRSNVPALALYQQMGFEVTGERANYYRVQEGVEDAILMRCHLEQSER